MKPEKNAKLLLGATRAISKMIEYEVPENLRQISIKEDPATLLDLTIGILGDTCANINNLKQEYFILNQKNENLLFSSYYFDALLNSKTDNEFSEYLKLLGAITYYLCGFPGSSKVLVKQIKEPNFGAEGLDWLSWALIANDFSYEIVEHFTGKYEKILKDLFISINNFFYNGIDEEKIVRLLALLREEAYKDGADRELLLADVICALCKKKLSVSTWNALPKLSKIEQKLWKPFIQKANSIKELWPSQLLLGDKEIFLGKSAVVQMPTSAGKTKASELVIRSAFLSKRTNLAIIVAPYRALCQEIYDVLEKQFYQEDVILQLASDVLQEDLESNVVTKKSILILTPEKLDYILRQLPNLAKATGLIIYDEGHIFDDLSRGVKYELLLASLKRKFNTKVQVILVSAVIGNADEISAWLTGKASNSIIGKDLHPTYRTIAFSSWKDRLGQLQFVDTENPELTSFFVPRILESQRIHLRNRETRLRVFPQKNDSGSIALYLACKLVHNGSVAIFSGRKDSANKMAEEIVDVFSRGIQLPRPDVLCDSRELKNLILHYKRNLGDESIQTRCAKIGIFLHHSSVPHGIRLAIEHSLQKSLIKIVICTSTLAQGVNLPLRYLIVTTDRQGKERIRIRDFHNLMGRAGRAGIYTEGTIIFSNPSIFDNKKTEKWRWNEAMNILNPEKSEPCRSIILSLLDPLTCKNGKGGKASFYIRPVRLAKLFYENKIEFYEIPNKLSSRISQKLSLKAYNKDILLYQLKNRINIFQSINNFLIQYICESDEADIGKAADELLNSSLAFHQVEENQKKFLQELFKYLQDRIILLEPSHEKRKIYSKIFFDIPEGKELLDFSLETIVKIDNNTTTEELFKNFWPVIKKFNNNSSINSCKIEEVLERAGQAWLNGVSFANIYTLFSGVRFGKRNATIDHIIDVCENGFGFQGSMIIGACIDIMEANADVDKAIINLLRNFQKSIKYGLPAGSAIIAYESGLSDRLIAFEISKFAPTIFSKKDFVRTLKDHTRELIKIAESLPIYYGSKLRNLVS